MTTTEPTISIDIPEHYVSDITDGWAALILDPEMPSVSLYWDTSGGKAHWLCTLERLILVTVPRDAYPADLSKWASRRQDQLRAILATYQGIGPGLAYHREGKWSEGVTELLAALERDMETSLGEGEIRCYVPAADWFNDGEDLLGWVVDDLSGPLDSVVAELVTDTMSEDGIPLHPPQVRRLVRSTLREALDEGRLEGARAERARQLLGWS